MRAVSSPSLSENPVETTRTVNTSKNDEASTTVAITIDGNQNGIATCSDLHTNGHGSVLQKLKNTLSHLKGNNKSTTASVSTMNSSPDSTTYRFGPLVWRSSKERRKAKHHRRDKCNSGDSGIQVELDAEDMMQTNDSVEASSPSAAYTAQVRRANSAKVQSSSSTVRGKMIRKNESGGHISTTTTPLPGRSLSQPSGLDRIPKGEFWLFVQRCRFINSTFHCSICIRSCPQ